MYWISHAVSAAEAVCVSGDSNEGPDSVPPSADQQYADTGPTGTAQGQGHGTHRLGKQVSRTAGEPQHAYVKYSLVTNQLKKERLIKILLPNTYMYIVDILVNNIL